MFFKEGKYKNLCIGFLKNGNIVIYESKSPQNYCDVVLVDADVWYDYSKNNLLNIKGNMKIHEYNYNYDHLYNCDEKMFEKILLDYSRIEDVYLKDTKVKVITQHFSLFPLKFEKSEIRDLKQPKFWSYYLKGSVPIHICFNGNLMWTSGFEIKTRK